MTDAASNPAVWQKLCAPFPPDQIEKLPKQTRAGDTDRGSCVRGSKYSADETFCGKYHARSVHLDYVGHAGITMRLNEAAGPDGWSWEPAYRNVPVDLVTAAVQAGLADLAKYLIESAPALYTDDGLWIKLTICGVTKLGFGDAQAKTGPNAVKEIIGDALRNAAMRFGVGTYLWSKSDAAASMLSGELGEAEQDQAGNGNGRGRPSPDPVVTQTARSQARRPSRDVPDLKTAPIDPAVALKTAKQATDCDDAQTLRGVLTWAVDSGVAGVDVRSAVGVEMKTLGLPVDHPRSLGSWLEECIRRVEAEGLKVSDQVRVLTDPALTGVTA